MIQLIFTSCIYYILHREKKLRESEWHEHRSDSDSSHGAAPSPSPSPPPMPEPGEPVSQEIFMR